MTNKNIDGDIKRNIKDLTDDTTKLNQEQNKQFQSVLDQLIEFICFIPPLIYFTILAILSAIKEKKGEIIEFIIGAIILIWIISSFITGGGSGGYGCYEDKYGRETCNIPGDR